MLSRCLAASQTVPLPFMLPFAFFSDTVASGKGDVSLHWLHPRISSARVEKKRTDISFVGLLILACYAFSQFLRSTISCKSCFSSRSRFSSETAAPPSWPWIVVGSSTAIQAIPCVPVCFLLYSSKNIIHNPMDIDLHFLQRPSFPSVSGLKLYHMPFFSFLLGTCQHQTMSFIVLLMQSFQLWPRIPSSIPAIAMAPPLTFCYRDRRYRAKTVLSEIPSMYAEASKVFLTHRAEFVAEAWSSTDMDLLWTALLATLQDIDPGNASTTLYSLDQRIRHQTTQARLRYKRSNIPGDKFFTTVLTFELCQLQAVEAPTAEEARAILEFAPTVNMHKCLYLTHTWFCLVPQPREPFFTDMFAALCATYCFQNQIFTFDEFKHLWTNLQCICARNADQFLFRVRHPVEMQRTLRVTDLLSATELLHFLTHFPRQLPPKDFAAFFDTCLPHPAMDWERLCKTPAERQAALASVLKATGCEARHYNSDIASYQTPDATQFACPLCSETSITSKHLLDHLRHEHPAADVERKWLLQLAAHSWPTHISSKTMRHTLVEAHAHFVAALQPPTCCGVCATASSTIAYRLFDFRRDAADLSLLHGLLSGHEYVLRCRAHYPEDRPSHFLGLAFTDLMPHLVDLPVEVASGLGVTCS